MIQNTSRDINARCLEARAGYAGKHGKPTVFKHNLFKGRISVFDNEALLDEKIEGLRGQLLNYAGAYFSSMNLKCKKQSRILLANLPWYKDRRSGVRAGSRWPHIKDKPGNNYLPFPFFLAYAASLLRENHIEAYLIDAIAEQLSEGGFLNKLEKIYPGLLVAETSTPSLENDLKMLSKIKNKDIQIALCGPDINIRHPEFLKENNFIDYVLTGEYENSLLELSRAISKNKGLENVPGLIYRDKNGNISRNPSGPLLNLDSLPWPLREELPMEKYLDSPGQMPLPSVQMIASRGCPFGCTFCLWPQVMYQGRNYRARNIKDVVDEMEYLVKDMGFKSIYFDDDTFNIGKTRMLEFCREIKKRGLAGVPWAIMARADLMDAEILKEMKSAGLWAVKYGMESAAQELVDRAGKNLDVQKAKKMIRLTKDLGVRVHLTFTFGLPGETKETIEETIASCLELDPYSAQFSITTPFPGTEYFEELQQRGLIRTKDWTKYDGNHSSVIATDNLSFEQLEEAKERACRFWQEHIWQRNFKTFDSKECIGKIIRLSGNFGVVYMICRSFHFIGFYVHKTVSSNFSQIKNALFKKGLVRTSKAIFGIFNLFRRRGDYLKIIGILDNSHAFVGPQLAQIDITDECNNNCIGCWCNSPLLGNTHFSKDPDRQRTLPFNMVKSLIDELAVLGTRKLFFSGGGEPFLHPDIFRILHYAKKKKMTCHLNTNFTLADKNMLKEFMDLKLDYLTVSIWAATAETYVATHPNKRAADFNRLLELLKILNTSKKKFLPHVKIYNVICNINYRELDSMINLARAAGSEAVEFAVIDAIPGATDSLLLSRQQRCEVIEDCKRIKEKCVASNGKGLKIINLDHFMRRLSDPGADNSEYDSDFIEAMSCYVGWLFARVLGKGDVNSCLKSHRQPVGNIYRQPFSEIWNSELQKEFRSKCLSHNRDSSFFRCIGNDPNCKFGCYKSCDNIAENIKMHHWIHNLSLLDKAAVKVLFSFYKPSGNGKHV